MNKTSSNRVRKHHKDGKPAKQGIIGGNFRYDRRNPEFAKGMGKQGNRYR